MFLVGDNSPIGSAPRKMNSSVGGPVRPYPFQILNPNSVRIVCNVMIPVVIGNETKNFVEFSSLPGQYLTLASTIDCNRLAGYGPITGEEQHGRGNFLGFHHSIQQAI